MLIARLFALFLYGTVAAVIAVTHFTDFIEDDSLRWFTCPADHVDFVEENERSLMKCLLKCSKVSACYGVFRHEVDMRCVGCQDKFLTNESAPSLIGTEYYNKGPACRPMEKCFGEVVSF